MITPWPSGQNPCKLPLFQQLSPRDLSIALEYGCLETELLDFLLVIHTEDEEESRKKDADKVDTAIETMRNAKCDMQNMDAGDISRWAEDIRQNLTKALKLKRNTPGSKKIKDDILRNIIQSIRQASEESNLDDNLEIKELEVPKLKGISSNSACSFFILKRPLAGWNPLCPAFSEAAKIAGDPEKGRRVLARRDIKVPYTSMVLFSLPPSPPPLVRQYAATILLQC